MILLVGMISNINTLEHWVDLICFINAGLYLTTLNKNTMRPLKRLTGTKTYIFNTCLSCFKSGKVLKVGYIDTYSPISPLTTALNIIKL